MARRLHIEKSCLRRKRSKEHDKRSAKARRPQHKGANLSARKSSTFARENTACATPNRRSRSDCRRREGPGSNSRLPKKDRCRQPPASGLSVIQPGVAAVRKPCRPNARARPYPRSRKKDAVRCRARPFRTKLGLPRKRPPALLE